jgi:hypothetical protein
MMVRMPQFVPVEELFRGRHFDQEIVVLNVRWYGTYKLSYRDLVAMMGESGRAARMLRARPIVTGIMAPRRIKPTT